MVNSYRFGEIVIEQTTYNKDVKILSDGQVVHPWWRREGHSVDPEDVEDLLRDEPQVIVLGMGQPGRMRASSRLLPELEKRGIRLVEKPTQEAVEELRNSLEQGTRVCAGFHLTC